MTTPSATAVYATCARAHLARTGGHITPVDDLELYRATCAYLVEEYDSAAAQRELEELHLYHTLGRDGALGHLDQLLHPRTQ